MKRTLLALAVAGAVASWGSLSFAQENAGGAAQVSAANSGVTHQQRARLNEKLRMAGAIIAQLEPHAKAQGLPSSWRQSTLSTLYGLSNETLASVKSVQSLSDLNNAIARVSRVTPKLGTQTDDLTYIPTTPCRYIDTRDVGGKINGTRSYDLDLNNYTVAAGKCASSPYGTYGATLAALALNMAIVDPSNAPGFGTIVPFGAPVNNALMNWYEFGPAVQASNSAIVTIDQTIGPLNEIDIFTSGPVHVIVDIFGAFRASAATALECTEVTNVVANVPNGVREFRQTTCGAGFTAVGGGVETGTNTGSFINAMAPAGGSTANNGWFASVTNNSGATQTYTFYAICCRVPGR